MFSNPSLNRTVAPTNFNDVQDEMYFNREKYNVLDVRWPNRTVGAFRYETLWIVYRNGRTLVFD